MISNNLNSLSLIVFSKENKEIRFVNVSDFGKNKKIENEKQKNITLILDDDIKNINLQNNDNPMSLSKKLEEFSKK
ncbi:MAG: hypothetical protein SOY60_02285 [Fusobacterium gastrosuis]|uniref:hypothetical protein n=1 Tax=Fusobacterium gastrosuis TaxID=1755100 RepID=UPI002A8BD937|nr:hypothetical protein [Fusobacterium gastrosuis]